LRAVRFVLVDRVTSVDYGRQATGVKVFSPGDDYFRDHFPGYPLVPGVLLLESMAQLGGRLIEASLRERSGLEVLPVLAMIRDARFHEPVRPGDRVDLTAEIVSLAESRARIAGVAAVGGRKVASAEVAYGLLRLDDRLNTMSAEDVEHLRAWSRAEWRRLQAQAEENPD
jgi:3-hydroxyacyl-[acyl-carrier-protein] dehydratase